MISPCGSIPIHFITERLSLSPPSSTRLLSASLTVGLPLRAEGKPIGLTVFHPCHMKGLGSVSLPVVVCPCSFRMKETIQPLAILAQACQQLWLVANDGIYQQFSYLNLTLQPSPLPHGACRFALSSRIPLTPFGDGVRCPARFIPSRYQGRMGR